MVSEGDEALFRTIRIAGCGEPHDGAVTNPAVNMRDPIPSSSATPRSPRSWLHLPALPTEARHAAAGAVIGAGEEESRNGASFLFDGNPERGERVCEKPCALAVVPPGTPPCRCGVGRDIGAFPRLLRFRAPFGQPLAGCLPSVSSSPLFQTNRSACETIATAVRNTLRGKYFTLTGGHLPEIGRIGRLGYTGILEKTPS